MPSSEKHNEKQITSDSFQVGKILKMRLDEEDGIILKGGYIDRLKYFVVIGQVLNDGIIGAFLINSHINENIISTKTLLDCQFPLKKQDYPEILTRNSYLDCSDFFEISRIKILKLGCEIGQLTDADLTLVVQFIETTEVFSAKEKKRFGFEDKS